MRQVVTLDPGQQVEVSFPFVPTEVGAHHVSVDGLEGSFTAYELPDVDFLTLDREELYTYLISKTIAKVWWQLDDGYRRLLGKHIVDNLGGYGVTRFGKGEPDCKGGPYIEGPEAWCVEHAAIRWARMNGEGEIGSDVYFVQDFNWPPPGRIWQCVLQIPKFGLPVYEGSTPGHSICALQIGVNPAEFGDWIFFQFFDKNIVPGDSQMPEGERVTISHTNSLSIGRNGNIRLGSTEEDIAHWDSV